MSKLKSKLFIIITLSILVVGMTLLGVFGFNQTVDYKDSYEVRVSIDQSVEKAKDILLEETNAYFAENGIKSKSYAFQKLDDGKVLVYKFNKEVPAAVDGVAAHVDAKLTAESLNAKTTVDVSKIIGNKKSSVGALLLGIGVATVLTFIFALIMEKLAASVAVAFSSALSFITFIALMSITRLPAYPFVGFSVAISVALAGVLSISTANRLRNEYKTAEKPDAKQIALSVMQLEKKKYLFTLVAVLIVAVALSASFVPYMMIVGGQVALAGLCAVIVSYFGTSLIWSAIKGAKK